MSCAKPYTIEKTVIDSGIGCDGPLLRTICKVIVKTVEDATYPTVLEKLLDCKVNEVTEFKIGSGEGDASHILDFLCKKMKMKESIQYKIVFHETSLLLPGETLIFTLCLVSWKERSTPLHLLKPANCFEFALENKETGTKLFKLSRFYIASIFYSRAVKYLIVAKNPAGEKEEHENIDNLLTVCHTNIAACLLKQHQYVNAIANCTEALAIQSNNTKALYRRAVGYLHLNDLDNAEKDILLGLKLDKQSKAFLNLCVEMKQKSASADALLSLRLRTLFS